VKSYNGVVFTAVLIKYELVIHWSHGDLGNFPAEKLLVKASYFLRFFFQAEDGIRGQWARCARFRRGTCGTPGRGGAACICRRSFPLSHRARRTASWCRGVRSRGCAARSDQAAWAAAAARGRAPESGSFHRRKAPKPAPA